MSSSFPTLTCYYSADGTSWSSDLGPAGAGDVSEIKMNLRELVYGTGMTTITLNNLNGKYMATVFSPWPQEAGCGYWWKWTINGVGPWYGRALDLTPNLSVKQETLDVTVGMMDDPIKNYYLTNLIQQGTVSNMILAGCQEWGAPGGYGTGSRFSMGGVTYTVDTSTNGPGPTYPVPNGYDCSRTRPYAQDFIRDLLITASDKTNNFYGWQGYVDSTQGPFATTLYVFQQGAKTYGSNLIYGTNISTIRNMRNITRSKTFVEYAGAVSPSEPPPGSAPGIPSDPWTENDLSMWTATSGTISASTTHWCPFRGAEVTGTCYYQLGSLPGTTGTPTFTPPIPVDNYSILGVGSNSGGPITLDLSLQTALGETFNALRRNATTLNFYYKLFTNALSFNPAYGWGWVQLKDMNGTIIQSVNQLNVQGYTSRGNNVIWNSWSAPVGAAAQFILSYGTGTGTLATGLWTVGGGTGLGVVGETFDWANITDIIFTIPKVVGIGPQPIAPQAAQRLWIDHLYFAESYQPTYAAPDIDAIAQYGQRMQYYDASMYYTDAGLSQFAQQNLPTMSPPAMQIDVLTSLGPEAETSTGGKGYQPGWSFPVGAVQVSNYGYNVVAWRAVEVETDVRIGKDGGCTTKFTLVPASTTGVGPNMAKFESRKYW